MKKVFLVIAVCIVIILSYIIYNKGINYSGVIVASAVGDYKDFGEFSTENNIGLHKIYDINNNKEYTNRQPYLYLRKANEENQLVACYYDEKQKVIKIGLVNYIKGNFVLEDTLYVANSQEIIIKHPSLQKDKLYFIQSYNGNNKLMEYDLKSQKESILIDDYYGTNYYILQDYIFYSRVNNTSSSIYKFNIENKQSSIWKKDVILGGVHVNNSKITYYKNDTFYINNIDKDKETKYEISESENKIMRILIYDDEYALIVTREKDKHLYKTRIYNLKNNSSKYIFKSMGKTFLPKTIIWMK
ncbi:MAG: hypothetical protein N4A50_13785 [Vallitalea sp.]|jgi:hypothetical protein|nr:hypothetical protein [Vallitalea sp.]